MKALLDILPKHSCIESRRCNVKQKEFRKQHEDAAQKGENKSLMRSFKSLWAPGKYPLFPLPPFSWKEILQMKVHVSHAHFRWLHALFLLATPSLPAHFQIQAFLPRGELCLEPSRFRSLELTNYTSQAGDPCPLTNAMDIQQLKELRKAATRNLETFALKQR